MGNRKSRESRLQQDRQASWDRLHSQPWSPRSDIRAFGSGIPRIQIVRLPSFSKPSFWEIAELQSDWVLYTATVVDPDHDMLSVRGYDRVEFAADKLKTYYDRLASLRIPAALPLEFFGGADGTITQLALFSGFAQVRYQWWSEHPAVWTPLVQIVEEMLRGFGESPTD